MIYNIHLVFPKNDDGKIKLTEFVVSRMEKYIQNRPGSTEAGGILLGGLILDSRDVVIDQITVPMKKDRRSLFHFFRHQRGHQKVIDRVWLESKGTCNYLGEWHTHPQNNTIPSNVDVSDWKRKLKEDRFHGDYLYFVIVGIQKINVWEGNRKNLTITKLTQME